MNKDTRPLVDRFNDAFRGKSTSRLELQHRLTYGLSLTIAQQRELFLLAFGFEIPIRTRCTLCNATGVIRGSQGVTITCPKCEGEGYGD